MKVFLTGWKNKEQDIFCSRMWAWIFFVIMQVVLLNIRVGQRWNAVMARGKMRTSMSMPVSPHPPQPHLPSPCLCKIKMRGSNKMAWIAAIRNTRYPLILTLCCDVFMFLVKQGVPSDEELDWLSQKLENWMVVGRRLKIDKPTLTAFDMENRGWFEKSYRMLLHWKERNGSTATYTILHDALCHPLVKRTDLAEQLMTGNIPLILKFNKYTITYKNSA